MTETVEFKDFSRPERRVTFKVGSYEYEAVAAVPLGLAFDMARISRTFGGDDSEAKLNSLWQFFDAALIGDGGQQIQKQAYDKTDPLDMNQLMNIMQWLLEVYGLRPTEPSSISSTGSRESGTSSTDGAPLAELTPSNSPSFDS